MKEYGENYGLGGQGKMVGALNYEYQGPRSGAEVEKPQSELERELSRASNVSNETLTLVENLAQRLSPVLAQLPPNGSNPEKVGNPISTDLGRSIQQISDRTATANSILSDILHRLEV